MKDIQVSKQAHKRIGKIEREVHYIQTDIKWIKNILFIILIMLLGLNMTPFLALGGVI